LSDLLHCRIDVSRVGIGHRLDHYGVFGTDSHAPHID
jgi:hypothetical protein